MKKDRSINLYLKDIHASIGMIAEFIQGMSKKDFLESVVKQEAVIRRIEVIGEAVKQLPLDFRDKYTDIPWKKLAGMRDKIIHGYFLVDLDVVWDVVKDDLPKLKKDIKKLLEE